MFIKIQPESYIDIHKLNLKQVRFGKNVIRELYTIAWIEVDCKRAQFIHVLP